MEEDDIIDRRNPTGGIRGATSEFNPRRARGILHVVLASCILLSLINPCYLVAPRVARMPVAGGSREVALRVRGGGESFLADQPPTPSASRSYEHDDTMGDVTPLHNVKDGVLLSGDAGIGGGGGEAPSEDSNWEQDIDFEQELDDLERELEEAHEARGIAERVNLQLKSAIEAQSLEIETLRSKINATQGRAQDIAELEGACAKCEEQKKLITAMCEKLKVKAREVTALVEEREKGESTLLQAKRDLRRSRLRLRQVMEDLDKVKVAGGEGVRLVWRCKGQLSSLADEVVQLRERNERLEAERRAEELIRRRLHNAVQELKGNIRVYCRIRPLIGEGEKNGGGVLVQARDGRQQGRMALSGGETVQVLPAEGRRLDGSRVMGASSGHSFTFDKVFGEGSRQEDVFQEIAALVQSALDGYRVCIFAYGQTGSGKTFTMLAPQRPDTPGVLDVEGSERGVIPRAVAMMFDETKRLKERGWKHRVEVSFVEIYNEQLRDLLALGGSEAKRLDIKHAEQADGSKIAHVSNLRVVEVKTEGEVSELLVMASRARATASTRSNEQSSRSHSVFGMHVRGWHETTGETCEGLLNLIDLAGSERLEKGSAGAAHGGGAAGEERLKETQAINKSLSSLCDVISALANKEQHVPFRNSKLTYLLQPSLGGDSKCLMFVNVSPARAHLQETLCSLRFASKVSSVQLRK